MALPTGQISISEVNIELNRPATQQLDTDDPDLRELAATGGSGVGGAGTVVSMDNLRGKARVSIVISANTAAAFTAYNLHTEATANANYRAGNTHVVLTVNPGIILRELQIPSSFNPGDRINVINNGQILGAGGTGSPTFGEPSFGGTGLAVQRPVTVINNNLIAGGGGGGGVGAPGRGSPIPRPSRSGGPIPGSPFSGGGGGGGAGASTIASGQVFGGTGGFPNGFTGTTSAGGAGGAAIPGFITSGAGGAGGNLAEAGTPGTPSPLGSGGSGFSGGAAVTGNPFITWGAFGTRTGPIS